MEEITMEENTQKQVAGQSDTLPLKEMAGMFNIEEEMGYDAPFVTFTWGRWLEMQTIMQRDFLRFQRAVTGHKPALAALAVLEMQEVLFDMYKETIGWL